MDQAHPRASRSLSAPIRRRLASLLLAVASITGPTLAAPAWEHRSFVDSQVNAYRNAHDVPGLQVVVAKDNRIVYSQSFGFADVKDKVPVADDTWFRLASVSKPVTAVLAMELEQQGKLHRNHKVRDHLKKLPKHHGYRVWHLMAHQSGVRHYDGKNFDTDKHYARMSDAIDRFMNDPLRFAPGQEVHYSTHGYTVLGATIEQVAGRTFAQHLVARRNAWGGMTHLQCEPDNAEHRKVASTYDRKDNGKIVESHRDDVSWKCPGGGMIGTARDLATLGIKLARGEVLQPKVRDLMWIGRDAKIEESNYGLGWGVGSFSGKRAVSHSGAQNGAASFWRILPDQGIVVVVLSNMREHPVKDLANFLTTVALAESKSDLPKMIF